MQFKELRGNIPHTTIVETTGAASSTGNLFVYRALVDQKVISAALIPSAAITADGTNYAIYTLTRHTAGASATTVATRSWIATNSAAMTEEAMTLSGTAANLLLTAGDTLHLVKTVAGSGLVIPLTGVYLVLQNTGV